MFLAKIFGTNTIYWHQQQEFWELFDRNYRAEQRYLELYGQFELPLETLKYISESDPINTPSQEEDFAGPCERWYCEVSGHLFLITYYYTDENFVRLAMEDIPKAKKLISLALAKHGITFETYRT